MLKLLLPVIFPSWRFFSSIGPSPRIHYAFLRNANDEPSEWKEFRSIPTRVSLKEGLLRLFYSPQWNETLYINTCAERLFEENSEMRVQEIMRRILNAVSSGEILHNSGNNYLVYRVSTIIREGQGTSQQIVFTATPALIPFSFQEGKV